MVFHLFIIIACIRTLFFTQIQPYWIERISQRFMGLKELVDHEIIAYRVVDLTLDGHVVDKLGILSYREVNLRMRRLVYTEHHYQLFSVVANYSISYETVQ